MSTSDRSYRFFEPLWRRIAVIVFVLAWFGFEVFYAREPLWMMIAGAMVAYGIWVFLLKWPKGEDGAAPK
jgi:hypothetical protein